MNQRQRDGLLALLLNGTWAVLLVEHICFNLELALPLACIWGIGTLLVNIRILARYIFRVEYK